MPEGQSPPLPLDPEIAEFTAGFVVPHMSDGLVAAMRGRWVPGPVSSAAVSREDVVVDAARGVVLRLHRPAGHDGPLPCLFWTHGGGYITGDRSMDDGLFETLCPELGIVAASVEYRMAPEHPYPAALDDAYDALLWLTDRADELGVDASRTGVGGISAGCGLAAALALRARERGAPHLAFKLLDSPMIDDRQQTPSSRWPGVPVWSTESNAYGWRSYLGELHGTDDVPAEAAPARAEELGGVPPALVLVGTGDGLLDESVDYAVRLLAAGVPTELHVYDGACHGYQLAPHTQVAQTARADTTSWLRRRTR